MSIKGFQQDGAPTHYFQDLDFLDEQYLNHWIGQGGLVLWSPRCGHRISIPIIYGNMWKMLYIRKHQSQDIPLDMTESEEPVKR